MNPGESEPVNPEQVLTEVGIEASCFSFTGSGIFVSEISGYIQKELKNTHTEGNESAVPEKIDNRKSTKKLA